MSTPPRVRCAIYTRKSSDEGLEQAFNSLDAQREACAAYVLSQASEGWVALPDVYDDGGLSGGTLERPALQRLLAEVAAGRIDIIVVYKVDRLTRSLLDFSKLVEAFDAAGTSFVSVTQSFNTTTSMGRLTLNMLLSFAQFEREVTAERIRDKIAASKARGMWMGGTPPLGYAPDGRSLAIVEDHAAIVRDIFQRYRALGNVRLVANALALEGVHAPLRTRARSGNTFGGGPFSRGQIYGILKCGTYIGEVHHKGQVYPGLHQPIITRDTWDQVQARLAANLKGHRSGERTASPALLAGKIVDADDVPLVAVHATKGTTRHHYYVSRDLQTGDATTGLRLPAREIEAAVTARVAALFADGLTLATAPWLAVPPGDIVTATERSVSVAPRITARDRLLVRALIERIQVHPDRIVIDCATSAIARAITAPLADDAPSTTMIEAEVRITRSGRVMRLVQRDGIPVTGTPQLALARLIVKGRGWWARLREGDIDIKRLGAIEGVQPAYITRVVRLAFLSPRVIDAILSGRCPPTLTARRLTLDAPIPAEWGKQEAALLRGAEAS